MTAEAIGVRAARMLKPVHEAYRRERVEAKPLPTWRLRVRARRYRRRQWPDREDRARHRAIRDELRSRGKEPKR